MDRGAAISYLLFSLLEAKVVTPASFAPFSACNLFGRLTLEAFVRRKKAPSGNDRCAAPKDVHYVVITPKIYGVR